MRNRFTGTRFAGTAAPFIDLGLDPSAPYFGVLEVPPLIEQGRRGEWRIERSAAPPLCTGYFRHTVEWGSSEDNWRLCAPDGQLWMSVTPMERESLAMQARFAKGRVLVGGAGLGLVLYNLMLNPRVSDVVVIDREPAICNMLLEQVARWRAMMQAKRVAHRVAKVAFCCGDLFEWCESVRRSSSKPITHFDFALLDIWPTLGDDALEADLKRIAATGIAHRYGAWGIELSFVSWCADMRYAPDRVPSFDRFSDAMGVPLMCAYRSGYAAAALQAARVQAGLWEVQV